MCMYKRLYWYVYTYYVCVCDRPSISTMFATEIMGFDEHVLASMISNIVFLDRYQLNQPTIYHEIICPYKGKLLNVFFKFLSVRRSSQGDRETTSIHFLLVLC